MRVPVSYTHLTQAGTSSSVRDPYPACGLIFHRRPLSGLPPHFRRERRIKRWGIAAGTATGAALGTKSNAKAERKCQNFALVTTLFSGSASPRRVGRGSSQYLLPSSPVATHFPALSATMPRGGGRNTARRRYAALVRCMRPVSYTHLDVYKRQLRARA